MSSSSPGKLWEQVDAEVEGLDGDYLDPKFYPLKHVVNIVSSPNPQSLVIQLREQQARLDALVDEVVQRHHGGFARSIQNYSQILQLFEEAKEQLDSLKTSLTDASRQLSAQSRHLTLHWRKTQVLGSCVKLLDEVQCVVDVPATINLMLSQQDWPAAVQVLLGACAKLAREELMKVGALRKIRSDMGTISRHIQGQILEELQARIYSHAYASTSGREESHAVALGPRHQRQLSSFSETFSLSSRGPSLSRPPSHPGVEASDLSASFLLPASVTSFSYPTGSLTDRGLTRAPALCKEVGLKDLVQCLVQLDALTDAKAFLNLNTRAEIRRLILRVVEAQAPPALLPTPVMALPQSGPQPWTVPLDVQAGVGLLIHSVLDACAQALNNLKRVVMEIAEAPSVTSSAGLRLLKVQRCDPDVTPDLLEPGAGAPGTQQPEPPVAPTPSASQLKHQKSFKKMKNLDTMTYINTEQEHVWSEMQDELQLLLAELLRAPLRSALQDKSEREREKGSWLEEFADMSERLGERMVGIKASSGSGGVTPVTAARSAPSRLTFGFDINVQGSGHLSSWGPEEGGSSPQEGGGYAKVLKKILGSCSGGPYLVPLVYRPVSHFVDDVTSVMMYNCNMGTPSGPRGPMHHQMWLQQFMDEYLGEIFLPQIWVDLRGRCTSALEDMEAFRPCLDVDGGNLRFSLGSPGQARRPLLRIAHFTEGILHEVMGWMATMTNFMSPLTGVVENVLASILDGCQTCMQQNLAGSKVGRMVQRFNVGLLMAAEPDAVLLDEPVAFCVPRSGDNLDPAVFMSALKHDKPYLVPGMYRPQVKVRGFGVEGEAVEEEVVLYTFRERPTSSQELLSGSGSPQRLVQLAALSSSLDYIADVILQLACQNNPMAALALNKERRQLRGGRQKAGVEVDDALLDSLGFMMDRCKSLAGQCVRALRLEMITLPCWHLHHLALISHLCDEDDVREIHACVGAFTRAVTRAAEETLPFLSPTRFAYVFGCVASTAARVVMWILPEVHEINHYGVERMLRTLSMMQPPLLAICSTFKEVRVDPSRWFDRARGYYNLLGLPPDEVVRQAAEKPKRFSSAEWMALLQVQVPGRVVTESQLNQLEKVLDKAYGLTPGQKVVEVIEQIGTTVQAPMKVVAGTIKEGFKQGLQNPAQKLQLFFRREGKESPDAPVAAGK